MSALLRERAGAWLGCAERAFVVEVVGARGSVPRGTGTRMLVSAANAIGTIGGGHLELKAITAARSRLARGDLSRHEQHYALGPSLGQCCGGAVTLSFEPLDAAAMERWPSSQPLFHLQLHGAGHVGRAVATALAALDCVVDWFDQRDEEFPATTQLGSAWPAHIRRISVDSVEGEVRGAPPGAFYLVLTHEHALDLRIAEAILSRGDFGFFGLIGSRTKRAKFTHRLAERGIPAETIARMVCPIGLPGIEGKEPEVIAAGVVAQLLQKAAAHCGQCRPMMKRLLPLATLLLFSAAASAHEYWLLPDRFAAAPGDEIGIVHRVGTGWPGENFPRDPGRIVRFGFVDRQGERPIEGAPGADPAGTVTLRTPGLGLAIYRSTPSRVSLEATLFESYLRDEGLDAAVAWRAAHGESALPGEEMFSRNAKAMVVATTDGAGPARLATLTARDAQLWRRPLGLTLEIVADTDPRRLASGAPFTVRVLYRGRPLAGALVKTFAQGSVVTESRVRTDAAGSATMTLGTPGVWLVNTVHMIDAPAGSGVRWESLWSSLVFELDR